jgi:hypothetical protein
VHAQVFAAAHSRLVERLSGVEHLQAHDDDTDEEDSGG